MNRMLAIVILILIGNSAIGQLKDDFFFNELGVSINTSRLSNRSYGESYSPGFSVDLCKSFEKNKKSYPVFGIRYSRYSSKVGDYSIKNLTVQDAKFEFNSFSLPLTYRLNFMELSGPFIEFGASMEFMLNGIVTGPENEADLQMESFNIRPILRIGGNIIRNNEDRVLVFVGIGTWTKDMIIDMEGQIMKTINIGASYMIN